jgi:hypothetical protein
MPILSMLNSFIQAEFQNEINLFNSFAPLEKLIYCFYAISAILVFRPHIRQALKYRHGEARHGDFHFKAQCEATFWRAAPLLYSITINSKLLFLSVSMDIIGRLWTMHEATRCEARYQDHT